MTAAARFPAGSTLLGPADLFNEVAEFSTGQRMDANLPARYDTLAFDRGPSTGHSEA